MGSLKARESGYFRSLTNPPEECRKGLIEPSQGLLERGIVAGLGIHRFLPEGWNKLCNLVAGFDRNPREVIRQYSLRKCLIVAKFMTALLLEQRVGLFRGRIKPVFERSQLLSPCNHVYSVPFYNHLWKINQC